jgi:hypothetical protein
LFKVYWTTNDGASQGQEIAELTAALQRTQELRNSGLARFVTVIAEDPNCTSLPGAAVMDQADYHWRKRRR